MEPAMLVLRTSLVVLYLYLEDCWCWTFLTQPQNYLRNISSDISHKVFCVIISPQNVHTFISCLSSPQSPDTI